MKTKKIQSILIAVLMLTSIAVILTPTIIADSLCSVRGYVHIDGNITQVGDIVLTIGGQDIHASDIFSDGYYIISEEMAEGDIGTFTVSYMGSSYTAAESVLITSQILYKINLTVDTTLSNNPPDTPSNPSPTGSNVNIESDLSWSCSDQNGDSLTYDVYFGTDSNPAQVNDDQTETTYALSTLDYSTTYYWKIVADDDSNGGVTNSPIWSFTTTSCGDGTCDNGEDCSSCPEDCGDCPPSNPPSDPNPPSNPPTLPQPIAEAGGDQDGIYYGVVDEEINLEGSSTSGTGPYNYSWDLDNDGDYDDSYEQNPTFIQLTAGDYSIKLKVKDANSQTDIDNAMVIVKKPNTPPYKLTINASADGSVDVAHDFTATAEDDDIGDKIEYGWDWNNDGMVDEWSADNYSSSEISTINHTFTTAGMYIVKAEAQDNEGAISGWSDELIILIDTTSVDIEDPDGKILDEGKDGTYDKYHNSSSGEEHDLGTNDDGNYLIDEDGDGDWDYVYDSDSGISNYEEPSNEGETSGHEKESNNMIWYILIIIVILLLLLFLAFGRKKKEEPKKKQEQKK